MGLNTCCYFQYAFIFAVSSESNAPDSGLLRNEKKYKFAQVDDVCIHLYKKIPTALLKHEFFFT